MDPEVSKSLPLLGALVRVELFEAENLPLMMTVPLLHESSRWEAK